MRSGSEGDKGSIVHGYSVRAPVKYQLLRVVLNVCASHQYKVAARESDMTMHVYMRNAVPHSVKGPKAVFAQSTLLKKRTWSVWGRASVQSWAAVSRSHLV